VVVFVHGGTWITGDRSYYEPIVGLYANLGRALARHGIVAVVPSYRIHPFGKLPDMIDDVTSALAWTHAHIGDFGGAPDRIVMAGHSAGAHLVSTLASDDATLTSRHADPSWVRGYALIGGIYDIPGVMDAVDLDEHVALLEVFGATLAQQASASTGERLHIGTRPLLLLAAKNDCRRCKADYAAVHARLASSEGGGVWFHELAGPTHAQEVLWVGTDDDEVTPWLRAFVERATDTGTTTAAAMARAH
jgi:acetyl esterase/lipase